METLDTMQVSASWIIFCKFCKLAEKKIPVAKKKKKKTVQGNKLNKCILRIIRLF